MMIKVWLGILLAAVPAAGEVLTEVEGLEALRVQHDVCALGALAIVNGQVVAQGVTGTVARDSTQKVTADARWHLGSCTKSMTATLAAAMIQKGMLDWGFTVGEAFADESFDVHADYQSVTLVELLSHRAGVPNDIINRPLWLKLWMGPDRSAGGQRQTIVAEYLPNPPMHAPKSKFEYSNVGYVIAGQMLEKQGGKTYEELLAELVFNPLEIKSAGFGPPPGEHDPRGHRAGKPVPIAPVADNPPGLSSAGRVYMTLADWGKYAQEHLRAARGESTKFLTPESANRLHTPPGEESYALGWGVPSLDWLEPPVLSHAGSNAMWYAEIFLVPSRKAAFLVTVNEGNESAAQAARDVIRMLANRYAPPAEALDAPNQRKN